MHLSRAMLSIALCAAHGACTIDADALGDAGTEGADGSARTRGDAGGGDGDVLADARDGTDAATAPCPTEVLAPGDHELTLTHDGVAYDYIVHVPPGHDPTVRSPLVVSFHGLTSSAQRQRDFSAMDRVADAHGLVVVYPDSPDTSWNAGSCCAFFARDRDDVGFAVALVDEMKRIACIDERRVYSTGFSNGGYMSHRLACERADVFAAIAPVAGTLSVDTCEPSRPISVIHFHGTEDRNVPYDGIESAGIDSVRETLEAWAERNGCTTGPLVTFEEDDVTCEGWTGCDDGVEVKLCSFEGMGHCWPGQADCPYGASSTTLDAGEEAARFFARFSL